MESLGRRGRATGSYRGIRTEGLRRDRGAWQATVLAITESDTTEVLTLSLFTIGVFLG